jgi:hypothetical protein
MVRTGANREKLIPTIFLSLIIIDSPKTSILIHDSMRNASSSTHGVS